MKLSGGDLELILQRLRLRYVTKGWFLSLFWKHLASRVVGPIIHLRRSSSAMTHSGVSRYGCFAYFGCGGQDWLVPSCQPGCRRGCWHIWRRGSSGRKLVWLCDRTGESYLFETVCIQSLTKAKQLFKAKALYTFSLYWRDYCQERMEVVDINHHCLLVTPIDNLSSEKIR